MHATTNFQPGTAFAVFADSASIAKAQQSQPAKQPATNPLLPSFHVTNIFDLLASKLSLPALHSDFSANIEWGKSVSQPSAVLMLNIEGVPLGMWLLFSHRSFSIAVDRMFVSGHRIYAVASFA